jgi:hypothetical protein
MLKQLLSGLLLLVLKLALLPFKLLIKATSRLLNWIWGLLKAVWQVWLALGPRWLRYSFLGIALLTAGYLGLKSFLKPNLTIETVNQVHYLNKGWTDEQRERFYYTPQGTELLGLEYDWFINLELPLSKDLLTSPDNMRGWGFIVTPGQQASTLNPGNLPVGLGRHIDPKSGKERLDLTCAMCHTGELHYQGNALRIDGGQAVQSISNAKRGEFITTLAASVVATLVNPSKWSRFADRVAGQDPAKRKELRKQIWGFLGNIKQFVSGAGAPKYYPVEEGRGRTDAVGRIANVVFGYDLDEPANYRVADAPVSYPFLWDIWRFDWVQYTGFTNQAMARNVGESLGVLAPIKLVNEDGKLLTTEEFGESVIDLAGMHCVEGTLRSLEPPRWPEAILGDINLPLATQGKDLFLDQCQACHGPHQVKPYQWKVASKAGENPDNQIDVNWQWDMDGDISFVGQQAVREDWREVIWAMPWVKTSVIGTDPTAADNFMDHRYDGSKIIPGSAPVNAGDGLQILLNRLVPKLYQDNNIDKALIADYDGLNVPFRIANMRAYKPRPLHGVWATPPFLHNGSVPNLYALLSPLRERPKQFYVGNREYNPERLGFITEQRPGSFKHDTSIKGNGNQGHLFTDVDMPGRIGRLLSVEERAALLEYLKVMGNPEFTEKLGGDPLDWSQYTQAPQFGSEQQACLDSFDTAKRNPAKVH